MTGLRGISNFMRKYSSWLSRHINDEFVKHSKDQGFRARSAFKILQILDKYPQLAGTIKKDKSYIVDLGAAPGSWSQAIVSRASSTSKVLAVDLLPIRPIANVNIVTLDFTSKDALNILNHELKRPEGKQIIDLVVSDLCANLTGNSCIDNANNFHLWQLAFEFSSHILMKHGHFVMKYFESLESTQFRHILENNFDRVDVFKPKASRSESSEKYFICINKKEMRR